MKRINRDMCVVFKVAKYSYLLMTVAWRDDCCLSDPIIHSAVHKYYLIRTPNEASTEDAFLNFSFGGLRGSSSSFYCCKLPSVMEMKCGLFSMCWWWWSIPAYLRTIQCVGWTDEAKIGQRNTRNSDSLYGSQPVNAQSNVAYCFHQRPSHFKESAYHVTSWLMVILRHADNLHA